MIYEFDLTGDLSRFHAKWLNRLAQKGSVDYTLVLTDKQSELPEQRASKSFPSSLDSQEYLTLVSSNDAQAMLNQWNEEE